MKTNPLPSFSAEPAVDVRFGTGGNGPDYQVSGWSFPEHGFTWSLGSQSVLAFSGIERDHDVIIVFEGEPFLQAPGPVEQVVQVRLGRQEPTSFRVRQPFRRSVRFPFSAKHGRRLLLTLGFPMASSPAAIGSADQRLLAIAWKRICLLAVTSIEPQRNRTFLSTGIAGLPKGQTRTARKPRTPACTASKSIEHVGEHPDLPRLEPEEFRTLERISIEALRTGETLSTAKAIAGVFGLPELNLLHDSSLPSDISVVRCTISRSRAWTFHFAEVWRSGADHGPAASMVVWHWLATLPLFKAYSKSGRVSGGFLLSLGDEAHARGVAFCSNNPEILLIPDPYFMRSSGYRDMREVFRTPPLPFVSRQRAALWRGSTTGYRGAGGVLALPRVRLCLKAREPGVSEGLDVGLTSFVQLAPGEEERLRAMDLFRPFVPPERFPEWMFHIDIDGNTSSWPGLFTKLLAGGVVLKVASEQGWRQWYYDRLEAHENFMPVAEDFSDLVDKVKFLSYSTSHAESLAEAAKNLTSLMSYEAETDLALATLEEAIVCEWVFWQQG